MADGFAFLDAEIFHREILPSRIAAGNGPLAAAHLAGVAPIALRVEDRVWTYAAEDGTVVVRGDDAGARTVVAMDAATFSDYANELRTVFGLVYGDDVALDRGRFDDWFRWEAPLRALYAGRPLYDRSWVDGIDLERSFTSTDPDAELAAYLDATGFLHVRGVFASDEIADLVAEVDRLEAAARPGDARSWWTTVDGVERCCRLIYANQRSARIAALGDDPRMRRLHRLLEPDLVPQLDCLDGVGVVIKQPGADSGLADLPWHQDCGLGGHPVLCPSVAVGVQLGEARPETGQLRFLAGSHRGSWPEFRADDLAHLPVRAVSAAPGDVTVHLGHVLHVAPPPTARGAGRRTLYVTACRPSTLTFVGEGRGYNDVLFARDGQVHDIDEIIGSGAS